MAHPDDEVIFGWPILQNRSVKKYILTCSSDLKNPHRTWCSHRKDVLAKLCDELGIECRCLDYNSEFYRLKTRDIPAFGGRRSFREKLFQSILYKKMPFQGDQSTLRMMMEDVLNQITRFSFDFIYTHNAWGEYGHLDHQLLHSVVASVGAPTIVSDIFLPSNWAPYSRRPPVFEKLYCRNLIETCENDMKAYAQFEKSYRDAGVWTWSEPPIRSCNLYTL